MPRLLLFSAPAPFPVERYAINRSGEPQRAAAAAARHVTNLRSYLASKRPAEHTREAVRIAVEWKNATDSTSPVTILDAGCGTGRSSDRLAEILGPGCRILGVDRSLARLERAPDSLTGKDVCLVRAELADFWRLTLAERWFFKETMMLYPNPVPCSNGLKRRWHGHPAFALAMASVADEGGMLVRSNWRGFLEEFAAAVPAAADAAKGLLGTSSSCGSSEEDDIYHLVMSRLADTGWTVGPVEKYQVPSGQRGISNFEEKYRKANQIIYQVQVKRS